MIPPPPGICLDFYRASGSAFPLLVDFHRNSLYTTRYTIIQVLHSLQTLYDNRGRPPTPIADAGAADSTIVLLEDLIQGADDPSPRRAAVNKGRDADRDGTTLKKAAAKKREVVSAQFILSRGVAYYNQDLVVFLSQAIRK